MKELFWVGMGGAAGAVLRYVVGGYVQGWFKAGGFPHGTLAVNILGCLLIGIVTEVVGTSRGFTSEAILFLSVGALGAFTTFATLSKETVDLFQGGHVGAALTNMGLHVVLGLAAVGGGYALGRFVQR